MSKSIARKISVMCVCMVIVCALILGLVSYLFFRSNSINFNAERARDIAQSVAAMIDPADFVEVMETGEKNDHWFVVKETLDKIKVDTDVQYLYVLGAQPTNNNMTYFAEGYDPVNDKEVEYDFGEQEDISVYNSTLFDAVSAGSPQASRLYPSGDFGKMVSGFAPIVNGGKVVGVVGVDIGINDVMDETNMFGLRILLIALVSCIVFGILSIRFARRAIGEPIVALTKAADQLAEGSLDVSLSLEREDEIGQLADSFQRMIANTRTQVAMMEQLADGDLNVHPQVRSEQDTMNIAINRAALRLNDMFQEILSSASQVSSAAAQISMTSQSLAGSTSEQAATVDQCSQAVTAVHEQSRENTRQASSAQDATRQAGQFLADSMALMDEMADAMRDINASSHEISQIIKVINDIAFQTNILALNAAVEAARAGQHGKGFAVVADEVRNLASKSAEAAKSTAALIEQSVQKAAVGDEITEKTRDSLYQTHEMAARTAVAMEQINRASTAQNQSIAAINEAMEQISVVVQSNSATAQQSAASAEELSAQATMLNSIVARFRLRDF